MSLLIGIHVNDKLTKSEKVTSAVGDRIFPVSTVSESTFPFIVYRRLALTPKTTKDADISDETTVEIIIAGDNYLNTIRIANDVRKTLQRKRGNYDEFRVISARLVSADDVSIEETYVQRLVFSFETEEN